MSEQVLLQIILALCTQKKAELKYKCAETYVNCAVKYGGQIMDFAEFSAKCVEGRQK